MRSRHTSSRCGISPFLDKFRREFFPRGSFRNFADERELTAKFEFLSRFSILPPKFVPDLIELLEGWLIEFQMLGVLTQIDGLWLDDVDFFFGRDLFVVRLED